MGVLLVWFEKGLVFGGGLFGNVEILFAKLARRMSVGLRRLGVMGA